jgi:hypothetical protein
MDTEDRDFLPMMIGILERLEQTAHARGEPLLASLLGIARGEAEDALRHAADFAALTAEREAGSSVETWRLGDAAEAAA